MVWALCRSNDQYRHTCNQSDGMTPVRRARQEWTHARHASLVFALRRLKRLAAILTCAVSLLAVAGFSAGSHVTVRSTSRVERKYSGGAIRTWGVRPRRPGEHHELRLSVRHARNGEEDAQSTGGGREVIGGTDCSYKWTPTNGDAPDELTITATKYGTSPARFQHSSYRK